MPVGSLLRANEPRIWEGNEQAKLREADVSEHLLKKRAVFDAEHWHDIHKPRTAVALAAGSVVLTGMSCEEQVVKGWAISPVRRVPWLSLHTSSNDTAARFVRGS